MVFNPNSRDSCDYYNIDFDTKRPLSKDEIERKNYESESLNKNLMKIARNSLVARGGRGSEDYFPQQSRDYALAHTIPCSCTLCPANKNSYCEVPSLIKMNAKAQCTTGLAFVEQELKRDPQTIKQKKDDWTPDWFFNRWDSNCPRYDSWKDMDSVMMEHDNDVPVGHADFSNDVRRVYEEKGIK